MNTQYALLTAEKFDSLAQEDGRNIQQVGKTKMIEVKPGKFVVRSEPLEECCGAYSSEAGCCPFTDKTKTEQ